MGCCCSSEAMPVYDEEPPTRFDVVVDEFDDAACGKAKPPAPSRRGTVGNAPATGSASSRSPSINRGQGEPLCGATTGLSTPCEADFNGTMYSPTESVAALSAPGDFQLYDVFNATGDPRDDIDRSAVDTFVQSVNPAQLDDTFAAIDETMLDLHNTSFTPRRPQVGLGLTVVQLSFIEGADSTSERLRRLQLVEEERRVEISNAMRITSRMLELAMKRIYPTIRTRAGAAAARPQSLSSPLSPPPPKNANGAVTKKRGCPRSNGAQQHADPEALQRPTPVALCRRPVLVIHHRDVRLNDETLNGVNRDYNYTENASIRGDAGPPPPPTARNDSLYSPRDGSADRGSGNSPLLRNKNNSAVWHGKYTSVSQVGDDLVAQDSQAKLVANYSDENVTTPDESPVRCGSGPSQLAATTTSDVSTSSAGHRQSIVGGPQFHHMEILELTAMSIPQGHKTKCTYVDKSWDFLSHPGAQKILNGGDGFFRFKCAPLTKADADDIHIMKLFANVTSFQDEERENNVPVVDFDNSEHLAKYTAVWVKAMYLFPGVKVSNLTAQLLSTVDYQSHCQPGNPKIFDDVTEPLTFRSQKVAVKFVYSIVVQMKCSEITDPAVLQTFRSFDGLVPAKVLVMERTKRDIKKTDSTAKCKSFLIFYCITGGLLVSHMTVILNTMIPKIVSPVISTFAKSGTVEAADTATLTRKYLIEKFGDAREK